MSVVAEKAMLERLLGAGFFPAELPPSFTSVQFSKAASGLLEKWKLDEIKNFWTEPETLTVSRYNTVRRRVSIVNPVNQLLVAKLIADNWPDIEKRLKRSKTTEFRPGITPENEKRSVYGVDFDAVERRQSAILAKFGRYIKTDITRYYPSIYTHSIAWAIVGKEHAKKNHQKSSFKKHYGNWLDKAVAAGQQGQTTGIPVGPDTSRIIAELVATEVEVSVKSKIKKFDQRTVRYVDDIIIGLEAEESAEAVLGHLSSALFGYGLELGPEKTSLHGIGERHTESWVHQIRTFGVSNSQSTQLSDISAFFELALSLSERHLKSNVLLFAIKRGCDYRIHHDNTEHFVSWLLYCCRRSPACIPYVAEFLTTEIKSGKDIPTDTLRDFILGSIPRLADEGCINEISWLLFWLKELGLKLPNELVSRILELRSSVCALVVADLNSKGLVGGEPDFSPFSSVANCKGLKSSVWLALYELTRREWWPKKVDPSFIKNHKYFGDILAQEISFYDDGIEMPKPKSSSVFTPFNKASLAAEFGYDE